MSSFGVILDLSVLLYIIFCRKVRKCLIKRNIEDVELGLACHDEPTIIAVSDIASSACLQDGYEPIGIFPSSTPAEPFNNSTDESDKAPPLPPRERTNPMSSVDVLFNRHETGDASQVSGKAPTLPPRLPPKVAGSSYAVNNSNCLCWSNITDNNRPDEETLGHLPLYANHDSHFLPGESYSAHPETMSIESAGQDQDGRGRKTDDADGFSPSDALSPIPIKIHEGDSTAEGEVIESKTSLGTFNSTDEVN